jgi:hypothetical protein
MCSAPKALVTRDSTSTASEPRWYIFSVRLPLALLAFAITYHRDIQHMGVVLPAAFAGVALLAGGAAVGLGRLPPTNGAHQFKPLWAGLVALAVSVTVLLVLIG